MTSTHEESQKNFRVKLLLHDRLRFADTEQRALAEPKDDT